jgi:hypothetical protein|tara:strand:+ start:342 stop:578 length:237 start_codon:yes stop_codon:yes gene_type:complete
MKLIITIESEEQRQKILEVLENAEGDGELDFCFSVQTDEGVSSGQKMVLNKLKQCQLFLEDNHPREKHLISTIKSLLN